MASSLNLHAVTIYYQNVDSWGNVKAYIYKNENGKNVEYAKWAEAPAMTKSGALYKIDVPAGFENGQVIFHNGEEANIPEAALPVSP